MTTTGLIFLSLLFIIVIMGVHLIGQAETIKEQAKELEVTTNALNSLLVLAREHLDLSKEYKSLMQEREKLREEKGK